MIVFVDGVDGSGKTTLVGRLDRVLTDHECRVRIAPPLWRYLPDLTSAADFPAWVVGMHGVTVAVGLLDAMTRRLRALSEDAPQAVRITLVDRGLKTVAASARAHAGFAASPDQALARAQRRCAAAIGKLLTIGPCQVIELHVEDRDYPEVLRRLQVIQTVEPRYGEYLKALHHEMVTMPAWPGVPTLRLNALDPIEINVARATAAIVGRD